MATAVLPPRYRRILERRGVIKPPAMPSPTAPKVEAILPVLLKKGFGANLEIPEPDPDDDTRAGVLTAATVTLGPESWTAENEFLGVALAMALADALEAIDPVQESFLP